MARQAGHGRWLGGRRRLVAAAGLVLLPALASAEPRPTGSGFIGGATIGGGRLGFAGGADVALALGPVDGQLEFQSSSYGVRDAWLVRAGEPVPGAERVVSLPASRGAGGFAMHGGYAFSRRLAVLVDVGVSAGLSSDDFNLLTGSVMLRFWPASRLWLEAGPAFGELGYGYDETAVRSGSITGSGFQGVAGVSVLRWKKASLDLEARFSSIGYDGFRANSMTFGIAVSRLPL